MKKICVFYLLLLPIITFGQQQSDELSDDFLQGFDAWYSEGDLNLFGANPPSGKMSLRKYLPVTSNLSTSQTPAGVATIATITQIAMGTQLKSTGAGNYNLSYSYVYNQVINSNRCSFRVGDLKTLEEFLKQTGTVPTSVYTHPAICGNTKIKISATSSTHVKVRFFKPVIRMNCEGISDEDCIQNRNIAFRISALKQVLVGNHAIPAVLKVQQSFMRLSSPNIIYNKNVGFVGNEPIVFIGYDDAKQAFEVAYAGGQSWGDSGVAWLKYEDLAYVKLAFMFQLDVEKIVTKPKPDAVATNGNVDVKKKSETPTTKPSKPTASTTQTVAKKPSTNEPATQVVIERAYPTSICSVVQINELTANYANAITKTPVPLKITGDILSIASPLPMTARYQIVCNDLKSNTNIYVLNFMPYEKIVHYPTFGTSKSLGERKISTYVVSPNTDFYVPVPRIDTQTGEVKPQGFQLDAQSEYMLILLTEKDLSQDLEIILTNINYFSDPIQFKNIVYKTLGTQLALVNEKKILPNGSVATTSNNTQAKIVPIIISLTGK